MLKNIISFYFKYRMAKIPRIQKNFKSRSRLGIDQSPFDAAYLLKRPTYS